MPELELEPLSESTTVRAQQQLDRGVLGCTARPCEPCGKAWPGKQMAAIHRPAQGQGCIPTPLAFGLGLDPAEGNEVHGGRGRQC